MSRRMHSGGGGGDSLIERYTGSTFDTMVFIKENIDAIAAMGQLLGPLTSLMFYRFVVPADSTMTVFTGEDADGRVLKVPGSLAHVYVNQKRKNQFSDFTLSEDGETVTFEQALPAGSEVLISCFGVNSDGTLYFDFLLSKESLIQHVESLEEATQLLLDALSIAQEALSQTQAARDVTYDLAAQAAAHASQVDENKTIVQAAANVALLSAESAEASAATATAAATVAGNYAVDSAAAAAAADASEVAAGILAGDAAGSATSAAASATSAESSATAAAASAADAAANAASMVKATTGEAEAGTDDDKYMTPLKSRQGLVSLLATQAEAEAGVATQKLMSPLRVAQAIAELAPAPDFAQAGWLPYDGVDGIFYSNAVHGNLAAIETPYFEDGWEYVLIVRSLSHNSGSSQHLQYRIELDNGSTPGYTSAINVTSATVAASVTLNGQLQPYLPRVPRTSFHCLGLISTNQSAPIDSYINVKGVNTADTTASGDSKISRLRMFFAAGNIDNGLAYLWRRRGN